MFEKLVVSTSQRRRGRITRFFLCTSLTYVIALAIAFGLSILLAEPKLADASDLKVIITLPSPPLPPRDVGPPQPKGDEAPQPNLRDFVKFGDLARGRRDLPLTLPRPWTVGSDDGAIGGSENGILGSVGVGPSGGDGGTTEPPPRPPDPPKPQPRLDDQKPLRMTSVVLQGKAIERVLPGYPEIVRRIRLQGDVSVEVIISPEGRVESARAISGHPMLAASAVDAARRWRFQPTFLNNVPVRVTGVIVFMFKLGE